MTSDVRTIRLLLIATTLAASLLGLSGCKGSDDLRTDQPATPPRPPRMPGAPDPKQVDPNQPMVTRYFIRVQLGTVEVPIGQASGSQELWDLLDEEPVSLKAAALGLNGLRIGLCRQDAWEDLQAVIEKMTGNLYRSLNLQITTQKPMPIVVKSNQPVQTMFMYRDDKTLNGRDFPPGDNLFTLSCSLNPKDEDDTIFLTAVPQVRTTKRYAQWVETVPGVPQLMDRPMVLPIEELLVQVPIQSGDILLVGPGVNARRTSSVGHHFLTVTRDGVPHETLLILQIFLVEIQVPADRAATVTVPLNPSEE